MINIEEFLLIDCQIRNEIRKKERRQTTEKEREYWRIKKRESRANVKVKRVD